MHTNNPDMYLITPRPYINTGVLNWGQISPTWNWHVRGKISFWWKIQGWRWSWQFGTI